MAFTDIFFKSVNIPDPTELAASYADLPEASPWAPENSLETITLSNLGLLPEVLPVSRTAAMQIASVAKGRNLICTSVSRMPLIALADGDPTETPEFLTQLEIGVPNFITLSWTVDSMLFHGRAFWIITERNADQSPKHIRYVPESKLETQDGLLIKAFGQSVAARDVIRLDANNEGFLNFGAGVIREATEIETASREAGATPTPTIVLKGKQDLSTDEIKTLLSNWGSNRRKRGGSVSYVNESIEVQSLGKHAEDLLIDGRNQAALQVARALGLPAWAVDASVQGQSLSYSNQQSRNREVIDALTGYMLSIEQTLSLFLPSGIAVKFDTAELLKPDTATRYEAYAVGINAGFLTRDEARSYENLEPLTDEQRALNTPESPSAPQPTNEESK